MDGFALKFKKQKMNKFLFSYKTNIKIMALLLIKLRKKVIGKKIVD